MTYPTTSLKGTLTLACMVLFSACVPPSTDSDTGADDVGEAESELRPGQAPTVTDVHTDRDLGAAGHDHKDEPRKATCEALPFDKLFASPERVASWGWSVAEVTVTGKRGTVERNLPGVGDEGQGALLRMEAFDVKVGESALGGRSERIDSTARVHLRTETASLDPKGAPKAWTTLDEWKGGHARAPLAVGERFLVVFMPDVTGKDEQQILATFPVGEDRALLVPALGFAEGTAVSNVLLAVRAAHAAR